MAGMKGPEDFEALARQYWGMWGEAMRGAMPQADAGMDGFRAALDAWTGAVSGDGQDVNAVMENFNRQSKQWYAGMQQVAAQFAGREHSAGDVVEAWRQALGASANPFQDLFRGMDGFGMEGIDRWSQAAAPWLQGMRADAGNLLGLPAFGFTREHQERAQALAQAQLRWQDAFAGYNRLMATTGQDAFSRFEAKLIEREEPGRQLNSVRALFDLWVDAAEEAYAQTALSIEYRHAYGELVNAQMQLRSRLQAIVEQSAALLGLPGRTELDSAHRKLAELERELRRMQRRADKDSAKEPPAASKPPAGKTAAPAKKAAKRAPASNAAPPAAAKTTRTPAAKKVGKTKPTARKR